MDRRDFVAATAAAATLPLRAHVAGHAEADAAQRLIRVRPFELSRVRLKPGPFLDATLVNRRFVMEQDPDRLLHMFRVTAGLPSVAEPLGGWEAPDNELRGHFTGHYLSACALLAAGLGDDEVRTRGNLMVAELARCQQAIGNGYLSAFPIEFFDRLRDGRRVWAPWYTLHKIMAGLLDMHTHCGNAQALDVLKRMATWTGGWSAPLSEAHMTRVLEVEYGGMNELLYNLAEVTGEEGYGWTAHRFDHERFFAPLADGRDELKGLHANTQVPKIIGAARRYELMSEVRYRRIAEYFWNTVTGRRAYCTGGTSNGEGWETDPGVLSTQLSGYTEESCVTYNMLKLTRHVFGWTADPACADYYERALFNGILGTQHPADGNKLYYLPLAAGYWKLFGTPLHDYWCCTGSGCESFAKFGDSIYFHDDDGIFVNLFIASEVDWPEKGLRVIQDTGFPEQETIALTMRVTAPRRLPLRIRVPSWAGRGGTAKLNGRPLEGLAAPGGYYVLDRTWKDGDRVELTFPMTLHMAPMPDDDSVQAIMYGPLVLAGRLGTEGLTAETLRAPATRPRTIPEYHGESLPAPALRGTGDDPSDWIKPVPGRPLEFRTVGQARDVTLTPLCGIFDERYAVYWNVSRDPEPARGS